MPMLDVFHGDAFNCMSLTAAINKLPVKWGWLGSLGIFRRIPVATTSVFLEEKSGKLSLLSTRPRGVRDQAATRNTRKGRSFDVPHIPLGDTIYASEVQNVRSFGSESDTESVAELVTERLQQCKDDHEVTHEWHRAGCIRGVVYDGDGTSEIYDWFDEFGITEQSNNLDVSADDVKLFAQGVIRRTDLALGATPYTRIQAVCGDDFWDGLITNPSVVAAYNRWQDGAFFREQQIKTGFNFAGIDWYNYAGKVGDVPFIPATHCRFIPIGVADLFHEYNAPADYNETVNTLGKPYYAKQAVLKFDTGVELDTQSNPLMVCTRPRALQKAVAV